jgi:hypothetical protein
LHLRKICGLIACLALAAITCIVCVRVALAQDKPATLPPAANRPVDFDKDIKPILSASCVSCHGNGKSKGGFRIDTRETFLHGGDTGEAAAKPGDSANSLVIKMVTGVGIDDSLVMPQKGRRLTSEEVGLLRAWIDQGAKWPDGVTFAAKKEAPLEPRTVAMPSHAGNPIDVLLADYFAKNKIKPAGLVDDRVFARRVWLDVVGLLPPVADLEAFVADKSADKREKLVHRLLSDNKRYTEHWLTFWNDLLRNDYKGTGYIDGGRKQITPWLYNALATNMPFDRFVKELVTGASGSEGFIKGIVWRGTVNAAQTPQMQAAQNISQVFMGANLKCASCHDSFVSHWKLEDAYGLASVYADGPLEMERCDTPLGKFAQMKFLYPQLGAIDAKAPKEQRLEALAGMITSQKNGRLARTIVNRLWKQFLGRGLVEPVDEMDSPPWNADLLDWLAVDLATTNQWDLKKTMARILTSRAYQMPVVPVAEGGHEQFTFRGPVVKRLTAEQFVDALWTITGAPTAKPVFNPTAAAPRKLPHDKARWIWSTPGANQSAAPGKVYFRKTLDLHEHFINAELTITADNKFELIVNGQRVIGGDEWEKPTVVLTLKDHLRGGKNVIAVVAENITNSPSPAGLFISGTIVHRKIGQRINEQLATDRTWKWSTTPEEGWHTPAFDDRNWKPAAELGGVRAGPWNLAQKLSAGSAQVIASPGETRAALCTADPLTTALGRTNREQVTTERQSIATTLQTLELSNGQTLSQILQKGAVKLTADKNKTARQVIEDVYAKALGRQPNAGELQAATELLGQPVKPEAVEDLLWIIAMLPEFQLIR